MDLVKVKIFQGDANLKIFSLFGSICANSSELCIFLVKTCQNAMGKRKDTFLIGNIGNILRMRKK